MRLTILLLVVVVNCSLFAAEPTVHFNQLTVSDGLSQISVYTTMEDHKGYIWFGTSDGLNRFDGYQFKHFRPDPQDPTSLSSSHITIIYKDQANTLWIGTDNGGLNRYDSQSQSFKRFKHNKSNPDSLSHNTVTGIVEGPDNALWISTLGGGVNRLEQGSQNFTQFNHQPGNSNSLSSDRVLTLYRDSADDLWFGTQGGGLSRLELDSGRFTHFTHDPDDKTSLSDNNVNCIYQDHNGLLWVGTDQGLNVLDLTKGGFKRFKHQPNELNSLINNKVQTITQDQQGLLWIGTIDGLNQYDLDKQHFSRYYHEPSDPLSLSNNDVLSIYSSSQDIVWVGTWAGGVNRVDNKQRRFGHFKHEATDPKSISGNTVLTLIEDSQGTLWIGTYGNGLNRSIDQEGGFEHFLHDPNDPNSLIDNIIWDVHQDSFGMLWLGTANGLSQFNPITRQFTNYQHDPSDPHSLSHNWIFDVFEDSQQQLWIATRGGGLNRFDRQQQRFEHYRHQPSNPNSISSDNVVSTYEDSSGLLWVATWDRGLNKFDPKRRTFEHYQHDEQDSRSISSNRLISVYEDSRGDIWVSSFGAGLNRLDPKTNQFERFRERDSLANDTVYGVVEDPQGDLWISTNQGLSRFNPQSRTFKNYDVNDGLQSNEFNGKALFISAKGELFFGGINGYNRFFAEQITDDTQPPNMVFTNFLLFNQTVAINTKPSADPEVFTLNKAIDELESLTLGYRQSLITFEFSALQFNNPLKSQYLYMLEGFDKQWIRADSKIRRATYTNLPAGTYTLRVKASNVFGYWNEQGITLRLTVEPPPWRTWWAYSLYSLFVISLIGLFGYQQLKKQQAIAASNKQLRLALWGSGDELWDVNLRTNTIASQNRLKCLDSIDDTHWQATADHIHYVHHDDKQTVIKAVRQHLKGQVDHYETTYRARTNTGNWIWLLDRGKVSERDESGKPVRFSGTTKNIHQLKTTEAELRLLTQELEQRVEQRTLELQQSNQHLKSTQSQLVIAEKMAALGNLVIGVAHEFNTPLGISLTAASCVLDEVNLLADKRKRGTLSKQDFIAFEKKAQETIMLALSSMTKASDLVNHFKQVAVNHSDEQITTAQLESLIRDSVDTTLLQADAEVAFKLVCSSELKLETYAHSLSEVFIQLVQNTLNHGYDPGEKVDISIEVVAGPDNIVITYQDQGKGMDPDSLKQLFDPFFTTNRGVNTGLGMYVLYNRISQLLQGRIKCHSAENEGCRFVITLPVSQDGDVE